MRPKIIVFDESTAMLDPSGRREVFAVAEELNRYGVAVRAGLHCAPSAHKKFGTLPGGTVRLAPSLFTSRAEVAETCRILRACAASGGRQGVK